MKQSKLLWACVAMLVVIGCQTNKTCDTACCSTETNMATNCFPEVTPVVAPESTKISAPAALLPPVHIKAGPSPQFTDADGNVWVTDRGFLDGETYERPGLEIANTKTPGIYQTERYGMSAFAYPVPNGKYTVKLHFSENYEEIQGAGQRVFSFNVEGKDFKNFDVYAKAGGGQRAYIETVEVEVTDGKLDITFTAQEQNPQINGIEILPAS